MHEWFWLGVCVCVCVCVAQATAFIQKLSKMCSIILSKSIDEKYLASYISRLLWLNNFQKNLCGKDPSRGAQLFILFKVKMDYITTLKCHLATWRDQLSADNLGKAKSSVLVIPYLSEILIMISMSTLQNRAVIDETDR